MFVFNLFHVCILPGALKQLLQLKSALQLLMNRYGYIRFAHVPERVSIKSFVVWIRGNSKSNHICAQGTFDPSSLPSCIQRWQSEVVAEIEKLIHVAKVVQVEKIRQVLYYNYMWW